MVDQLTYSKITSKPEDIEIPQQALDDLSKLAGSQRILSVYSSNAKALYFFPIKSEVYFIQIQIYPLTPEIVANIMGKLAKLATRIIYSTGLCIVAGDKCFWEGFIQKEDITQDISKIKEFLMDIDEVKDVVIELIE